MQDSDCIRLLFKLIYDQDRKTTGMCDICRNLYAASEHTIKLREFKKAQNKYYTVHDIVLFCAPDVNE